MPRFVLRKAWLRTAGTPPTGIPTTAGVANPYTEMGLAPETTYDFYVRADCGGDGTSMWVGPMSFTTACAPIAAPFTEDFETFTTDPGEFVSENCWTGTGGNYYWESAPGTDAGSGGTGPAPSITTGNYFYTEASAGASGDTTDLIAPLVDLTALTAPSLSFDYHMFGGEIGTLEVWVNGVVEWSLSGEQQTSDTEPWRTGLVNLSAYSGQTIAVIFRGTSAGVFEGDIAIDNVSFDELPSCPDPSMLMASNISDTSAELSWTEVGTAALWNVEIVDITAGGTPTGTATDPGVTNPYMVMGLTQNNDYEYYVQSDCSGETSNWVGPFAFTTLETCPAPSGMATTGLTETSADLSWTAGNTEVAWNLEWNGGADFTPGNGEEEGSSSPVTNPEATLSGLTAATNYFVYYQADCGGDVSDWVGPFEFYTGHCLVTGTNPNSWIDNFSTTNGITNISNLGSGLATDNYEDNFNTLEVSGFATGAFDFSVEIVGGTVGCAIWVDWNNDLLFDVSEVQFTSNGYADGPFTGTVNIPGGTPNGDYRMRVMIDWNDPNPGDNDACSLAFGRGEVEDYKVVVGDAPTDILDFYSLWFPPDGNIAIGSEFNVFAQCFEAGLTDTTSGQAPGIECWIGYSDMDTDPSGSGWTWIPAGFNVEVGNNDEYFIDLGGQIAQAGVFYYAARWRLNGGIFTYGGIQADGSFGGEWH